MESPGKESLTYHPSKVSWAMSDFIKKSPSIFSRLYIYVLLTSLLVLGIYSYKSIIPVTISVPGSLVSEKPVFTLNAAHTFKVNKLNIKKYQKIKKNEFILESEDQLSLQDYKSLVTHSNYLSDIISKEKKGNCISCLEALLNFSKYSFKLSQENGKSSFLKNQIIEFVFPIQELIKEYININNQTKTIEGAIFALKRQINLAQEKLNTIKKNNSEKLLSTTVDELKSQISNAQSQISEKYQNNENQLIQLRSKIENKLDGFVPFLDQYRIQREILSPIDGVVNEIKISGNGVLINQGQPILEISQDNTSLLVHLLVQNKDISVLKKGMEVNIKLDALNEREFGSIKGKIFYIPDNIVITEASQNSMKNYEVHVKIDQQSIVKNNKEYPFKMGMTLTGLIIVKKESLLNIILKKILNIKDDLVEG